MGSSVGHTAKLWFLPPSLSPRVRHVLGHRSGYCHLLGSEGLRGPGGGAEDDRRRCPQGPGPRHPPPRHDRRHQAGVCGRVPQGGHHSPRGGCAAPGGKAVTTVLAEAVLPLVALIKYTGLLQDNPVEFRDLAEQRRMFDVNLRADPSDAGLPSSVRAAQGPAHQHQLRRRSVSMLLKHTTVLTKFPQKEALFPLPSALFESRQAGVPALRCLQRQQVRGGGSD